MLTWPAIAVSLIISIILLQTDQAFGCASEVTQSTEPQAPVCVGIGREPREIARRIFCLAKEKPHGDAEFVTRLWMEYELSRPAREPVIPSYKRDYWLHLALGRFFNGRHSASSTRRFLSILKKKDFDLYEVAVQALDDNKDKQYETSLDFDGDDLIRRWQGHQRKTEATNVLYPPRFGLTHVNFQLARLMRGDIDPDLTLDFLIRLEASEPEYYDCLLERWKDFLSPYRVNIPQDNQRWVDAWEQYFRKNYEDGLIPISGPLREAVLSLLSGKTSRRTQTAFMRSLQSRDPLAFSYALSSKWYIRASSATTDFRESTVNIDETAESWSFWIRMTLAQHSPLFTNREDIHLAAALREIANGQRHPTNLLDFSKLLLERNRFLHDFLQETSEENLALKKEGYEPAAARGKRWAYEWSYYYRHRLFGEPVFPSHRYDQTLNVMLGRYRLKRRPEGETVVFYATLAEIEPDLLAYANTYFNPDAPRDPELKGRHKQSDFRRYAQEWVEYYENKSPEEGIIPNAKRYNALWKALKRYRLGQMDAVETAGFLGVLQTRCIELYEYTILEFQMPQKSN